MPLRKKIKKFIYKNFIYKNVELTPRGYYFKNYCDKIVNSTLDNRIMAYEELIEHIKFQLATINGIVLDREETAKFILETYEEIL